MKHLLTILVLFTQVVFTQVGNLQGKITDGTNPIPSVNIFIIGTGIGTASDKNGNYSLKNIPIGNYQVRFSAIGFETVTKSVSIQANKTTELNVALKSTIIEFQSVEVTARRFQEQSDTRTSLIDVDPRSAKILPGAAEDIMRTLQALPGVVAPNDFSSQLIIRGSGPDQNLIIMDDVEIFNPYRLYGVISMFNPDAVEDVNLISGGFPVKYGDRLSAVLDVTNREGDDSKNLKAMINTSIADANLVLEGRNPFNIKGSWLFNSRRTYYDLIIEPFVKSAKLVDENTSFPNFYDLQTKLVFGPFDGHKILLNGIISRDGVNVISGKKRRTADSVGVYNETKHNVAAIAWHYAPSKKFLNKFILSYYRNFGDTDFDSQILDPTLNRSAFEDVLPDTVKPYLLNFKFDGGFDYNKITLDNKSTYIWDENVFEAGAGVDFMETTVRFNFEFDQQLRALFSANPQFRSSLNDLKDVKKYSRYRLYAQNTFKIGQNLFINPGLRLDHFQLLEKTYLSPRISFSYALDGITTLRAAYGLYYQSPGYEKFFDQNVLFDLDKKYTKNLKAERAIHYVLGIERWLTEEWNLRVESYYKKFDNLIVPKIVKGTQFHSELIPGRDPFKASSWTRPVPISADSVTQIPINDSNGEAYGLEFLLAKKNTVRNSKLTGWISYSLAFADRYERGVKYPFRFDQRHTLNIVLNYEFNNWFYIGLRWQYGSGFPLSIPYGVKPRIIYADTNGDGVFDTPVIATRRTISNPNSEGNVIFNIDFNNDKFNSRKPAYHRLDVRFNFLTKIWGLNWTFYLDVINIYNRKNVVGYDYFIKDDLTIGKEQNNMFPILPTLGVSVRF
jgi:outer membrane cobalamin receptor